MLIHVKAAAPRHSHHVLVLTNTREGSCTKTFTACTPVNTREGSCTKTVTACTRVNTRQDIHSSFCHSNLIHVFNTCEGSCTKRFTATSVRACTRVNTREGSFINTLTAISVIASTRVNACEGYCTQDIHSNVCYNLYLC